MTDDRLEAIDHRINGLAERLHFGNISVQGRGDYTLTGVLSDMLITLELIRDQLREVSQRQPTTTEEKP